MTSALFLSWPNASLLLQMLSNSTTSSRVAKTSCSSSSSQRVHHVTSSEMKASSMKSDLTELKSSISEMKNISSVNFNSLRKSMEDLVDMDDGGGGGGNGEPLVTFPDTPDSPTPAGGVLLPCSNGSLASSAAISSAATSATSSSTTTSETVKYEQKRMKVVTDQYSAEQETANSEERRHVQTGEMSYQEQSAAQALRARLEVDGVSAEKSLNMKQTGGCDLRVGGVNRLKWRRGVQVRTSMPVAAGLVGSRGTVDNWFDKHLDTLERP
ncbi:Sterile alpha and TIR motif-containing protein 1 [Homalodisca vitripennis]|nr:Sterile alpha and TIR motif-containing protein 1 [Homalodisca vitripennis]